MSYGKNAVYTPTSNTVKEEHGKYFIQTQKYIGQGLVCLYSGHRISISYKMETVCPLQRSGVGEGGIVSG